MTRQEKSVQTVTPPVKVPVKLAMKITTFFPVSDRMPTHDSCAFRPRISRESHVVTIQLGAHATFRHTSPV